MKRIGILILILLPCFCLFSKQVAVKAKTKEEEAKDRFEYYATKFEDVKKKIEKEHKDDDGNTVGALKDLIDTLNNEIATASQETEWDATASDNFKKYIKEYFRINSVYKDCSHDFKQLSYEYNGWKNDIIDPSETLNSTNTKQLPKNKDVCAAEAAKVDKTQIEIERVLDNYKNEIDEIFLVLSDNMLGVQHNSQILDFVANFCVLGGSVWMILGFITLAGSLKDKNGPALQTSTWQIVGGIMIVFATYLFRNSSQYPNLLNEVLWLASRFTRVGGAMWSVWGIIILAGAIKDKTGPALQSAIWQIVGGIMIMMASYLFTYVVRVA